MNKDFYGLSEKYEIYPGMSESEVEEVVGKPLSVKKLLFNNVELNQWHYKEDNKEYYLYFNDGILCVLG